MTGKKGHLQEILSKALHADDPGLYTISYRDFDSIVQVPLIEFLNISKNFELVPASRIVAVSKNNIVMYRKFSGK